MILFIPQAGSYIHPRIQYSHRNALLDHTVYDHKCFFRKTLVPLSPKIIKRGNFLLLYSTLLYLPPLRLRSIGEYWDRTQDCWRLQKKLKRGFLVTYILKGYWLI